VAAGGAAVAICSRRADAIEAAARELRQDTGADVVPFVADLSRAPDPARVVQQTVDRFGGLDVLVTNTGGPRSAPFEALSDQDWQDAVDSLLMSVVRLCRAAVPHTRARWRPYHQHHVGGREATGRRPDVVERCPVGRRRLLEKAEGGDYVTGTTIPVDGGYLRGVL